MTTEREREGCMEAAIRQSERDRIVAWLRTDTPPDSGDIGSLADAIERGEHWGEKDLRTIEQRLQSFQANYRGDNKVLVTLLRDIETELKRRKIALEDVMSAVTAIMPALDALTTLDTPFPAEQEVINLRRAIDDHAVAV